MDIKKNILSLSLGAFLMFAPAANASKLPNDVWNFVKGQLPQVQQRFDSVLTLSEDVMYIPLSPPSTTMVDEIKVEYAYPENKSLSELPEVVLLNNGYSLLKVFKDDKGNYKCFDRFEVIHIKIDNKQITELKIVNTNTGVECFNWKLDRSTKAQYIEDKLVTEAEAKRLYELMKERKITDEEIATTLKQGYGVQTMKELKASQYAQILRKLKG